MRESHRRPGLPLSSGPKGWLSARPSAPVPAIDVPRSRGQISAWARVQRAVAGAGLLARGWAIGLCQHVSIGGTMPDIPADLRYSKDHLWARPGAGAGLIRVGVTDFAQQSIGDVIDVSLPSPGDTVKAGEACGDIESVKSVSDLIAPVTGTVRTCNDDLAGAPELVNADPYGQGWMFEVEPTRRGWASSSRP